MIPFKVEKRFREAGTYSRARMRGCPGRIKPARTRFARPPRESRQLWRPRNRIPGKTPKAVVCEKSCSRSGDNGFRGLPEGRLGADAPPRSKNGARLDANGSIVSLGGTPKSLFRIKRRWYG